MANKSSLSSDQCRALSKCVPRIEAALSLSYLSLTMLCILLHGHECKCLLIKEFWTGSNMVEILQEKKKLKAMELIEVSFSHFLCEKSYGDSYQWLHSESSCVLWLQCLPCKSHELLGDWGETDNAAALPHANLVISRLSKYLLGLNVNLCANMYPVIWIHRQCNECVHRIKTSSKILSRLGAYDEQGRMQCLPTRFDHLAGESLILPEILMDMTSLQELLIPTKAKIQCFDKKMARSQHLSSWYISSGCEIPASKTKASRVHK